MLNAQSFYFPYVACVFSMRHVVRIKRLSRLPVSSAASIEQHNRTQKNHAALKFSVYKAQTSVDKNKWIEMCVNRLFIKSQEKTERKKENWMQFRCINF